MSATVPVDGKQREVVGKLSAVEGEDLVLVLDGERRITIPMAAIAKARLEVEV